eukprot:TRINITY_DN15848_c0_g2_i2.p1 TRINITY_DN15848_c0_g2~~TRINITY_DN15848_c0_g2_i2.p1  ORF type:complete len:439 (+),score=79.80 TRINITY_DN15848_c0_g2_i2:921-2237(+)
MLPLVDGRSELNLIKKILIRTVNILDTPRDLTPSQNKKKRKNINWIQSMFIIIAKCCEKNRQIDEGLEYINRIPEDAYDINYVLLWKAILYSRSDIRHPEVEKNMRKIDKSSRETLSSVDYRGFFESLMYTGGKSLAKGNYEDAFRFFSICEDCCFKEFAYQFEMYNDLTFIRPAMNYRKFSSSGYMDMLSMFIRRSEKFKYQLMCIRADIYSNMDEHIKAIVDYEVLLKNMKPSKAKHEVLAMSLWSYYTYGKFARLKELIMDVDFDVVNSSESCLIPVVKIAVATILHYDLHGIGEYLLNNISIRQKFYGSREGLSNSFEDLAKLCYELMTSNRAEFALKLTDVAFLFYFKHKDIFLFHLIKAKILRQQRNLDLSIRACKFCLKQNPKSADAYFELGMSQMLKENLKEARNSFNKCLKLKGDHKNAIAALNKLSGA